MSFEEHAQNGLGLKLAHQIVSVFPSPLPARVRALCAFEEHAQNGLGLKLAHQIVRVFPSPLLARVRALCAIYRLTIVFALAALPCFPAEPLDIPSQYVKTEYRIPMRDGVHLFTEVYTPKDNSAQWPILLNRTPYGTPPYGPEKYRKTLGPSLRFTMDKFIFVYQDVRGRYLSEGEFIDVPPIKDSFAGPKDTDETTDTYDTIDWLVKNVANNNGKVGQYGTSYPGFYTDSALVRSHPALVAASPQAPMADLFLGDDAYHNGALFLLANFGFYTDFPKQNNPTPPPPEKNLEYGTKDGYQFYLNMGPVANSEKFLKNQYWTDVYSHSTYDQFWKPRNLLPHLQDVSPAVLVVGGWYDPEDLSGALKTFRALSAQTPRTVTSLVMGPWQHGGWNRSDGAKLGDIPFGSKTAEFFRDEIEFPFFRHYLKGDDAAPMPKAVVFKTGKNEWEKLPQWPPAGTMQRLYLQKHGGLAFRAPESKSGSDEYVSDPDNPVPFLGRPTLEMRGDYMLADQRFLKGRKDVLTYMTPPLTDDLTVAGPLSPTLFVSTSGTDSDFDVKVIDVYPHEADGHLADYQQLVRGEPFRGKFRNSFEHPEPFPPGVMQTIHFSMPDVYHSFLKGHRIMVQIQSSWFPLTDRNPQTFTDIPHAAPEAFVKARQHVFRSRAAASYVEMNVAP